MCCSGWWAVTCCCGRRPEPGLRSPGTEAAHIQADLRGRLRTYPQRPVARPGQLRFPYNRAMLRDLAPLFSYMRRYRWGYIWGTFACVCTNAIWVQFPRVLESAI